MQSFKITLSVNAVLTGLHNFPSSPTPKRTPLLVALHGGTYTAKYFDVDASHSASSTSNGLEVPFIAINRPGYADSTSFCPIPTSSSYTEEYGTWLHRYILPALWQTFGEPNGCTCIVLLSHSLGAPGAILAASMHAKETIKPYPLAGISMSGFGSQTLYPPTNLPPSGPGATTVTFPPQFKDSILLQKGHADPEMYKYTQELNHDMTIEEAMSIENSWFPKWREWAKRVACPVMIGIASHDLMWEGTEEHLKDFSGAFTGSERVDGTVVEGAPHNMEMSFWARGWYARCFGFALECAASFAQKKEAKFLEELVGGPTQGQVQ